MGIGSQANPGRPVTADTVRLGVAGGARHEVTARLPAMLIRTAHPSPRRGMDAGARSNFGGGTQRNAQAGVALTAKALNGVAACATARVASRLLRMQRNKVVRVQATRRSATIVAGLAVALRMAGRAYRAMIGPNPAMPDQPVAIVRHPEQWTARRQAVASVEARA